MMVVKDIPCDQFVGEPNVSDSTRFPSDLPWRIALVISATGCTPLAACAYLESTQFRADQAVQAWAADHERAPSPHAPVDSLECSD